VPIAGPDDPITELGTITCSITGEADAGKGSSPSGTGRNVSCEFRPGQVGPLETYVGTLQGVGQTKLLFNRGAVLLSVKGPASTVLAPGILTQSYAVDAGSSASAFAPLVGEKNKRLTLQPLAEEEGRVAKGATQPEAVLILVELKLQSSPG
jgi:hypothetical protein